MENTNGSVNEVIDYNFLIHILMQDNIFHKNLDNIIVTKKGIIYKNIVHVFSKCNVQNCSICLKYKNSDIIYPKRIKSKL